MTQCISSYTSEKFIDNQLRRRQDLNVMETEWIRYRSSDRAIAHHANEIYNHIKDDPEYMPLYVILNLVASDQDDKHAVLMIVMRDNDKKYVIYLFDPNGKLKFGYTKHGEFITYPVDTNILNIAEKLAEKLGGKYVDLMDKSTSVNIVGTGNCDAIVLWFIYTIASSRNLQSAVGKLGQLRYDIKKDPKKATSRINTLIMSLSKR